MYDQNGLIRCTRPGCKDTAEGWFTTTMKTDIGEVEASVAFCKEHLREAYDIIAERRRKAKARAKAIKTGLEVAS